MNRFVHLLVFSALLLTACAGADDQLRPAGIDVEQLLARMAARPGDLETVRFRFRQSAAVEGQSLDSEGECLLAEGGRLRMVTRMPTQIGEVQSLLVADGSSMWHEISAGSIRQVIRYDLSRLDAAAAANLSGLGLWGSLSRERFAELRTGLLASHEVAIAGIEGSGAAAVYVVEARAQAGGGQSVRLGVEDYFPRSLVTVDGNGITTNLLEIDEVETNVDLSLSQFTYVPPEGVQVGDGNQMIAALERSPRRHRLELTEAPDFTLPALDGSSVSLHSLRGKTVVIDFWATWCGPCLRQMPHLQRIHEALAEDGVVVLGVNTENADRARRYVTRKRYSFPVLVDDGTVAAKYQVRGLPTTVIVNREGIVDHYLLGPQTEQRLRSVLAESGVLAN